MLKIWVAPEPLKELNYGFFQKPDSMKATFRNERLINIKLNVSCFLVSVFVPCCALWVEEIRSLSHQRHLTWGKPSALVSFGWCKLCGSFHCKLENLSKFYRSRDCKVYEPSWCVLTWNTCQKNVELGERILLWIFYLGFDSRSMPVSLQKSINYDSILNETFREYFFFLFRSLLTC